MPFPGFAVLLPCVGAAAIIFVGSNARTTCWLANPLAQAIGAISYSLYLCHWPLIFFTRFIFGAEVMTATTKAILIAIMGITATAMYFFVEKPFVHGRSRSAPAATTNVHTRLCWYNPVARCGHSHGIFARRVGMASFLGKTTADGAATLRCGFL